MSDARYCNCYDPWNCREPLVDRPCRPWTKREKENAERADKLEADLKASNELLVAMLHSLKSGASAAEVLAAVRDGVGILPTGISGESDE